MSIVAVRSLDELQTTLLYATILTNMRMTVCEFNNNQGYSLLHHQMWNHCCINMLIERKKKMGRFHLFGLLNV